MIETAKSTSPLSAAPVRRARRVFVSCAVFGLMAGLIGLVGFRFYRGTDPESHLQRGQEALALGDLIEAEQMADRLESSGYADHAHLLRGQTYLALHRPNEAIREYNQIRQTNDEIITRASVLFGLAFLSYGETQRARKLFQSVLSAHPENVDARKGLGALYYDQGAMDFARRQLERWAELDPADGQPHRFLGRVFTEMEEAERAIEQYKAALALSLTPKVREEATVEFAELLIGRQAFADALAWLDACPFESVDSEAVAELQAECHAGLGRPAEAARHLSAGAREHAPSPRRPRLEARLHRDAGELNRAVDSLEKALRLAPHDTACREQLAAVYELQGRRAEAAEQGRLLAESRKLYGTLRDLKRKANRRANDPEIRQQLAGLCERLGKQEWAARWLRAASLCPKQEDVQDE